MKRTILLVLSFLACGPGFAQDAIALKPFVIDHRGARDSTLDLSYLLDAPAGKQGYIQVRGGHLVKPNGERFRIWGVNLTAFASGSVHFPPKEDAAFWAGSLARIGVNCVRLHFFDIEAPKGIIAPGRTDTRSFDADQLDRMDYFVAALKNRGIYVNMNLNVGRRYKAGDGVKDYELIGYAKAVTYFDPRLIELQKEYARQLLTHYNPYTKSEYRNEPAVALVEIVNENSLTATWIRGRLTGTKTSGPPENWQDIPPSYEAQLTKLYNDWLAKLPAQRLARIRKLAGIADGQPVPRLKPTEFDAVPRERFETEASFYIEMEKKFLGEMRHLVKATLGVKAPLIANSDYSYGKTIYPSLSAASQVDVIDSHGPWERNAIVNEPLNSIPVRLSRSAMSGKPFTVSEHNHRFPSDYMSEGIPMLAAYAAFQDWDGIFLYTFETKLAGYAPFIGSRADLSHDPVKLPNLVAGALMFLRPDVSPARQTVERSYSRQQVIDSILVPSTAGVYFTPGVSPAVALQHGSRISSLDGAPTRPVKVSEESPVVSDTKELAWYYTPRTAATVEDDQKFTDGKRAVSGKTNTGLLTVDTARTQALIGFLNARKKAVKNLSAEIRNPFATLVLSSLDGKPVSQSSRMLFAATARVTNSPSGGSPTLIEPVTGNVVIRNLDTASAVSVSPLNGAGSRMGKPISARKVADGWEFEVGKVATTWYEITVSRP